MEHLIMNIEREIKVRAAIKYCIENFDSKTATNRIVEFWKNELKLQEQLCNIANVVGQSERLVCEHKYQDNVCDWRGVRKCIICGQMEKAN